MQLKDNQQVTLSIQAVDGKGFVVADGGVAFSVSDPAAVALTDNGDGTCLLVALAPATGVVVTATDGAGLSVTDTVDVIPGDAVALRFVEGTPVDQPPAAPAA